MLNLPKPGNSEIDEHKPETENGVPRVKPMAPEIAPSGALSRDHSSTDNAHALLGKRDKPEPAIADKDFRMIPPHD